MRRCPLRGTRYFPQAATNERQFFCPMTEEQTGRPAPPDSELALTRALHYVRSRWLFFTAISLLVLLPCFWHKRIEAGDLASHTYNAWLAQLIERGQAPSLYLARQWTNVLFDLALLRLGNIVGLAVAEKIVVSACVLVFFWGAFALIAAASRQPPWFLVPAIAMITYGWTFHMGFINYYLSLGLGFCAAALFWRGRLADYVAATALMALALMAHPMGFVCIAVAIAYIKVAECLTGWRRWLLFGSAFLIVFAIHYYIVHHFQTQYWQTAIFYVMNGADQLVLYGRHYRMLAMATILIGSICFLYADLREGKGTPERWRFRTPLELWSILLFIAAMIPELIQLPFYPGRVGYPVTRLTSVTAVMGLCMLGHMRPRPWHLAGFGLLATLFFALMYRDTGTLNKMEEQAENLASTLPYGRRVTEMIAAPLDSRVFSINHIVDRACIGHCFAYSNYEPACRQFHVRVRQGSPLVTDSFEASQAMEYGNYVVRPNDLPMTEIYQCDEKDPTHLCMRDLTAGEKSGRVGGHPSAP